MVYALSVLLVAFWALVVSPMMKATAIERNRELRKHILRMFVPGERMTVQEFGHKLETVTGGRVSFPDNTLYTQADILVAEGKLCVDMEERDNYGFTNMERVYSLPEKK